MSSRRSQADYQPSLQYRAVCSGTGKKHELHAYQAAKRDQVERDIEHLHEQKWTEGCRPFVVEQRSVGPWGPAT